LLGHDVLAQSRAAGLVLFGADAQPFLRAGHRLVVFASRSAAGGVFASRSAAGGRFGGALRPVEVVVAVELSLLLRRQVAALVHLDARSVLDLVLVVADLDVVGDDVGALRRDERLPGAEHPRVHAQPLGASGDVVDVDVTYLPDLLPMAVVHLLVDHAGNLFLGNHGCFLWSPSFQTATGRFEEVTRFCRFRPWTGEGFGGCLNQGERGLRPAGAPRADRSRGLPCAPPPPTAAAPPTAT